MYRTIVLYLLSITFVTHTVVCGEYFTTPNSRYYVSYPQKANWYEAGRYCTANGMQLTDITTTEENNNIVSILNQIQFKGDDVRRIWIGGTDLGQINRFHWDSTGHIFSFEDFKPGQPDDTDNLDNCVDINIDDDYKWYDEVCLLKKYFICKKVKKPLLKNCRCINN